MDLETIQTFLLISTNNSFTKTAKEMFCTQAAVSMRIQRLEKYLNCNLFDRKAKKAELTKDGHLFLPYAQQISNTFINAKEHLLQSKLMEQSEISITSSSTPGTYILPNIMFLFRQKYPFITVVNNVQYTQNVINSVLNKTYSLGIISQPYLSDNENILCEPILEDPLVVVANNKHPWAKQNRIFFHQMKNETFLISNPNTSLIDYLEKTGNFKFVSKNICVVGSVEAIKQSIYDNLGISVVSESAVKQELKLGLLSKIEIIDDIQLMRHVYYIKRKDEKLPLSTELFLKFVKEIMISKSKKVETSKLCEVRDE
ncbi:transcriptional regulator [Clostridium sp. K25]|uniref:LysR family transcriptional regulator n=1 Tax=Clostridium TaxID=1485 RepID=UPI0004D54269|nr:MULTISPECIES: LysR family transcriptional regulator [Clostridium]AYF54579.1 LysR family transcriptional regulator [Clostridium novyi]KEI10165.1 transcriptional regulator [Clostridium sp. K25]